MKEDKRLKIFLVLQSLCPLFILLFIQHIHISKFKLIYRFFRYLINCDWSVFSKILHPDFGDLFITCICIAWFLLTSLVSLCFHCLQYTSSNALGDEIKIKTEKKDSGVTFLVTFILPLLTNDVSNLQNFIFFLVLFIMVLTLLIQSDLFYQNPVLVILQYKTFEFVENSEGVEKNKTYIGLSKGKLLTNTNETSIIYRRYIADNVFLIYKK